LVGQGRSRGLRREGEDGCGPSGQGADDGARSTELQRAARRLERGRWRARESGERERELGEGERKKLGAFIEREGRGEGAGEERPAFNAINGVVSLHLLERERGGGRGGAVAVVSGSRGGGRARPRRGVGRGRTGARTRPAARH
jgi:hypothetical protein